MAPRTRYFLVGSGLVVVVGLCTGLVAYYSGTGPGSARRTEMAYVPRTASAVGYANVSDIMGSEFHQHLRKLLPTGGDKARFQEETGIDIERDIDSVVVAMNGEGPAALGALVVVRGRFDQTKIEAIATGHGAAPETYGDIRMLVAPSDEGPGPLAGRPTIAFLESGLIAFGTRDAVKQGIDAAATGAGASQDSEWMEAVSGVEGKGNAWFVARTDAIVASHSQLPEIVRQNIKGVRWLAIGADVDRGVQAVVRAETQDPQAAQDLRAIVNGAIAAVRLTSARDARFESALSSIRTSGSGTTVELQFTLPAELLDMAKDRAPWQMAQ